MSKQQKKDENVYLNYINKVTDVYQKELDRLHEEEFNLDIRIKELESEYKVLLQIYDKFDAIAERELRKKKNASTKGKSKRSGK